MAVLPQSAVDLTNGVEFVQQPSKTWYINQETGRIQGEIDGLAAVTQAVDVLLNVERFRWQIYRTYSGVQWEGLIGQDPGYVASELQRRITQALTMDDRVRGISNFSYSTNGNTLTASFTVNTVYGATQTTVEVNVA
ncbi:DUF2634 domain-containing protein [Pseudoflavonifractor phocaeensis]|uniref:DUF2634 domain-containing protein n=1 Tax=Oscillospiraceae TaxID=216572 RepID=UPI001748569D|nr:MULTISPECIES: DUF2634 domain-containing protein [Oscillospiraceae]MBM6725196.1 DUF2634 domain-containing protein [Pseudoflavonifractor phocaeensis]MBM6887868.1 DUF2634 domain-containing protein [Pseudoflavonifractor phocaeensis]